MSNNFIKKMLSSSSEVSSKRVSGLLSLLVSLGCIVYLTIDEGGTSTVESLLQTSLIIASCLLGVSSVTSIWKAERSVKSEENTNKDIKVKEKTERNINK